MPSGIAVAGTPPSQAPEVLTVAEAAEYLRIPRSSIYKLAKRRGIPSQKVGRQWRFSRRAIDAWLASLDRLEAGLTAQAPDQDPSEGIPREAG